MSPRKKQVDASIVLPVGGGKGGIGKSAVAANLAMALARLERRVILVDADLGGSDLHILLGLANDRAGLGELMAGSDLPLASLVRPLPEPRLSFLPGDAMMVATANPSYQKKRKILHSIKGLEADFTLLDLGAGTAITVMDFFLASPLGLLVTTPERPAVLSTFNFLKNAVFRTLEGLFRANSRTRKVLDQFRARSRGPGSGRMSALLEALEEAAPGQGEVARETLATWRPKLILNRVRRMEDFVYARQVERWAADDLGLSLEVLGFIPEDEHARSSTAKGVPALEADPRAPFCRAVALLAWKISPWAGRREEWLAQGDFAGSFERSATEFAPLFPPPGAPSQGQR